MYKSGELMYKLWVTGCATLDDRVKLSKNS